MRVRFCFGFHATPPSAGLLLTYTKVTGRGAVGGPVLMVQAGSNPDLKWEFLVQEGLPQSVLVTRLRRTVRLVRLQCESQCESD